MLIEVSVLCDFILKKKEFAPSNVISLLPISICTNDELVCIAFASSFNPLFPRTFFLKSRCEHLLSLRIQPSSFTE
jgi:hypothetical protein